MLSLFKKKTKTPEYWTVVEGTNWLNFDQGRLVGFSDKKPSVGDWVFADMKSGKVAVFKFVSVEPCRDPSDMFFGTVKGLGYKEDLKINPEQPINSLGYVL